MCKSSGICAQNKAVSPPKYIIKHAKNNFFLVGGILFDLKIKKRKCTQKLQTLKIFNPFRFHHPHELLDLDSNAKLLSMINIVPTSI